MLLEIDIAYIHRLVLVAHFKRRKVDIWLEKDALRMHRPAGSEDDLVSQKPGEGILGVHPFAGRWCDVVRPASSASASSVQSCDCTLLLHVPS